MRWKSIQTKRPRLVIIIGCNEVGLIAIIIIIIIIITTTTTTTTTSIHLDSANTMKYSKALYIQNEANKLKQRCIKIQGYKTAHVID